MRTLDGVEHESWVETRPLALCDEDMCPWKHAGVDLWKTQQRARAHVSQSGHTVTVYRELRRKMSPEFHRSQETR